MDARVAADSGTGTHVDGGSADAGDAGVCGWSGPGPCALAQRGEMVCGLDGTGMSCDPCWPGFGDVCPPGVDSCWHYFADGPCGPIFDAGTPYDGGPVDDGG